MKKIILTLFVGGLALTSCKKDLTCECTVTKTETTSFGGNSDSSTDTYTTKSEIKEINKRAYMKQYPDYCKSYTETKNNTEVINGESYASTFTDTYDCKLAK